MALPAYLFDADIKNRQGRIPAGLFGPTINNSGLEANNQIDSVALVKNSVVAADTVFISKTKIEVLV